VTEQHPKVFDGVATCLSEVLRIDRGEIEPTSDLLELGAQSFDFVKLVFRLERTYGIEIPRRFAVPHPYTVETLVNAVRRELDAVAADQAPHAAE